MDGAIFNQVSLSGAWVWDDEVDRGDQMIFDLMRSRKGSSWPAKLNPWRGAASGETGFSIF
jgi:hypothetical protein